MKKISKGFTLIELLVVIGILAILLAITLIAINPARQFAQANNTRRRSDVLQVLNAVHQYNAEHAQLPTSIANMTYTTAINFATGGTLDALCGDLMPTYIPALPVDPKTDNGVNVTLCSAAGWDTGYQISKDNSNRITVIAPATEQAPIIQVTR